MQPWMVQFTERGSVGETAGRIILGSIQEETLIPFLYGVEFNEGVRPSSRLHLNHGTSKEHFHSTETMKFFPNHFLLVMVNFYGRIKQVVATAGMDELKWITLAKKAMTEEEK